MVPTGGDDTLQGGAGADTLEGGAGADALDGGAGDDTASYSTATDGVTVDLATPANNTGDARGDTYTGIENLAGSDHDDTLTGDASDNTISGGAGADALDGGAGNDTASYSTAPVGVTVDLATPANNTGDALGDTYTSIEIISGSAHDDILTGDANANTISGGAGNDVLTGGAGDDTLKGGDGTDEFRFYANFGNDTISDYNLGASEKISVCMGTSASPPTQTGGDHSNGSDYVITVTFAGATAGTITLKGITTGSDNFANLNVKLLVAGAQGGCIEPEGFKVWFNHGTPNHNAPPVGRIFMQVTTNKPSSSAICKINDGGTERQINCPPQTLVSLPVTSSAAGAKVSVWAEATVNMEAATTQTLEWIVGGPKLPEVEVSGGNGKLLVGWEAPEAITGAINAYIVQRRQRNADGTWPTTWTEETKAATDREHAFTGLANGTWQVRVRARNNHGDTDDSTHILGIFSATRTIVLAAGNTNTPGTPSSAAVTASQSSGNLIVTWRPPANETGALAHGYTIRHKVSGADDSTYVETTVHPRRLDFYECVGCPNPGNHTISDLTAGTNYVVGIRSHNANGDSAWHTIGTTHTPN